VQVKRKRTNISSESSVNDFGTSTSNSSSSNEGISSGSNKIGRE
jgi:hypothetical protein